MLSVYLAALGVGSLGLGAGLLVGGPISLERRLDAPPPVRPTTDALDLHADRSLGSLEGGPDILWRPMLSPHFWTLAAACFGAGGLALVGVGASDRVALGGAIGLGLGLAWAGASVLRSLPPRSSG